MNKNEVVVSGLLSGDWKFDHEYYGERFYNNYIKISRSSGTIDTIMVVASEDMICEYNVEDYCYVIVDGSITTYNLRDGDKRHLKVFINAFDIRRIDISSEKVIDINNVEIEGFICKSSDVRTTPLNKTICDVILASNNNGKSSYIPCVFWGKNAFGVSTLPVGTKIVVKGRIQSRIYKEINTAYELSVQTYDVVE